MIKREKEGWKERIEISIRKTFLIYVWFCRFKILKRNSDEYIVLFYVNQAETIPFENLPKSPITVLRTNSKTTRSDDEILNVDSEVHVK